MGKLCLLCIAIFLAFTPQKAQNIGINGNGATPDASAMLDNALPFKKP